MKYIFIRRVLGVLAGVVLLLALCWVLYSVMADYTYSAVSGVYKAESGGSTSILRLNADRTFEQDTVEGGKTLHARGTWRRIGEGGVVFSKEFLRENGESARTDGQVGWRSGEEVRVFLHDPYPVFLGWPGVSQTTVQFR